MSKTRAHFARMTHPAKTQETRKTAQEDDSAQNSASIKRATTLGSTQACTREQVEEAFAIVIAQRP